MNQSGYPRRRRCAWRRWSTAPPGSALKKHSHASLGSTLLQITCGCVDKVAVRRFFTSELPSATNTVEPRTAKGGCSGSPSCPLPWSTSRYSPPVTDAHNARFGKQLRSFVTSKLAIAAHFMCHRTPLQLHAICNLVWSLYSWYSPRKTKMPHRVSTQEGPRVRAIQK